MGEIRREENAHIIQPTHHLEDRLIRVSERESKQEVE
jgi:hypothetical protein